MKKFKIKTRPSEEIRMAINGELDDKFISEISVHKYSFLY